MVSPASLAIGLIFLCLWAVYLATGLVLDGRYHFLTVEAGVISARAILSVKGPPASLANLPITHPPLPFGFSIPFAALDLPLPAVWVSSLMGALLSTWMLVHFRGHVSREPALGLVVLLAPFQAGMVHSAATGTAAVCGTAFLALSTYLICRFVLEQQTLHALRRKGRVTAWLYTDVFQADRMRFLWSSALLLALAGLGRFDLLFALPVYLVAAPFLLPRHERTDVARVVTVSLVYLLPLVALHLMWAYLCWVFAGDPLYGLKNPASYFQQVNPAEFLGVLSAGQRLTLAESAREVVMGVVWGCPVLFYVFVRLRSVAVVLVCMAPFFVQALALRVWGAPPGREFYALAYMQAVVLLMIGFGLRRFGAWETRLLALALAGCTALSWWHLAGSPVKEERVWSHLVRGEHKEMETFYDERQILQVLEEEAPDGPVLLDEGPGFAFVALRNSPDGFLLSHQSEFTLHAENPHVKAGGLLLHTPGQNGGLLPRQVDAVTLKWNYLDAMRQSFFEVKVKTPTWTLLTPKPGLRREDFLPGGRMIRGMGL